MAILKHIASKSSNYGAALEYLIFKHDELRKTPILDQNGNRIMRDEFYLDGLNCEPYSFDAACQQLNREYQKNKNKDEIKSHHYIISFDPADKDECGLTGERAQAIGLEYAKANFPGHQSLVCTHMDGHNGSGNIHVHSVINSLRKLDVPQQPFMERPIKSTRWRWSTARFSSGIWNHSALHKNRPEENPPAPDRPQYCAAYQLVGEVTFILCKIRVFLSSHPGSRNNPFAQTDIFPSKQ